MAGPGSRFHRKINGRRWHTARRHVLEASGWRCEACGKSGALEVHHVRALHKGGNPWAASNLSVLCRSCHIARHRRALTPAELKWRTLLGEVWEKATI